MERAAPTSRRYISPTDMPFHEPPNANLPPTPPRSANPGSDAVDGGGEWSSGSDSSQTSRSPSRAGANQFNNPRPQPFSLTHPRTGSRSSCTGSELAIQVHPPPDSPIGPEPPTPDPQRDIHLQALASSASSTAASRNSPIPDRPPPAYSPLDAFAYSEGVQIDLPAEMIAAALERGTIPANMIGSMNSSRSDRHRSRRERR